MNIVIGVDAGNTRNKTITAIPNTYIGKSTFVGDFNLSAQYPPNGAPNNFRPCCLIIANAPDNATEPPSTDVIYGVK